jgi:hypothetical protein
MSDIRKWRTEKARTRQITGEKEEGWDREHQGLESRKMVFLMRIIGEITSSYYEELEAIRPFSK